MSRLTEAQLAQYVGDQLRYHAYKLREQRLAVMKYYGVRVEVTNDMKKCYVMGRLVVCLPRSPIYIYDREFNSALRHVLDTLIAVNDALHAIKEV